MTPQAVAITTACASAAEVERIAALLVDERLVACAQVHPIRSTFRWQGAVDQAEEWLLTAKTRASLLDAVIARIDAIHSYDLPEVVALPILGGSAAYLAWIEAETLEAAA